MGIAVGYMGTKRYLAGCVAEVVALCSDGVVLDAFAGMCSVGEAVGSSRIVWNNDVQVFASEVARAHFTSADVAPLPSKAVDALFDNFSNNKTLLSKRFSKRLKSESEALDNKSHEKIVAHHKTAEHVGNNSSLNSERKILATNPTSVPYRLATITFADGYFGLAQSIEIDSIRYAADCALISKIISADEHRWISIALCQASAKVATTTGHFAQFMKPSESNFKRFCKQRKKSVWLAWLECLANLEPLGSSSWRKKNKVFQKNSLSLLSEFKSSKSKPSVIYADPPYTADHYSRYYHVWETLSLYDYPEAFGEGRYRPDRFATPFSIKTTVIETMKEFVEGCRSINADLVLSYPNNGILQLAKEDPLSILKKSYGKVDIVHSIDYQHSTMGGSTGASKSDVKEYIYWARP